MCVLPYFVLVGSTAASQSLSSDQEWDLIVLGPLLMPGAPHWIKFLTSVLTVIVFHIPNISQTFKQSMSSPVPMSIPVSLGNNVTPGEEMRMDKGSQAPCREHAPPPPTLPTQKESSKATDKTWHNGTCELSKSENFGSSHPTPVIYYLSPT